tara:strand:+ start:1525 stop:2055 length:531 start_codon:yes stop_codon:yes gene_type:complete
MKNTLRKYFENIIIAVNDFPKKGVVFRDVTPLFLDSSAYSLAIREMKNLFNSSHIDLVLGIESRGFLFGISLAVAWNLPFGLVRKKGKLPRKTNKKTYSSEYGEEVLEIHEDVIKKGMQVLIVDDILATGGTIKAAIELVEGLEGQIKGILVFSEIKKLEGRKFLNKYPVKSLLSF